MKKICIAALLLLLPVAAQARTILFVGNSFTFGEHSALKHYHPETVHDLNPPDATGQTIGGVPALFKAFAVAAGLDYDVSLETVGGKGIDYHYDNKHAVLDKAWDVAVLQSYSTLDQAHPGDAALLVKYAALWDAMLKARNPKVQIWLNASWSRADLTYPAGTPWNGKPIAQMGKDVYAGYRLAQKSATGIVPTGLAWNRAFATGLADDNPYDGIAAGKIDLWAFDHYHASAYGYFLEALMVFGRVTGRDPLSVGHALPAVDDLGLDPKVIDALEQIAHDELAQTR